MATTTPTPILVPRPFRWLRPIVNRPLGVLEDPGEQLSFFGRALAWGPRALPAYWKEIVRLIAEVSLGSGALAVILGSVGVIGFLTFFTGTEVGLEGYQGLNQIGISAFAGFVSASFNTREIAPLVVCLVLTATVGARFTAQLGAMRLSEEVDALEVMGIPSVPYLVTTRIV